MTSATIATILSMAARPLLGALIGYITNDIAIRMLFRPHRAKYIGRFHIPFTPGIIPKEKGRIASAIGNAISENLMNREVVEKALLSPQMTARIEEAIDSFLRRQSENDMPLREFLLESIPASQLDPLVAGGIGQAKQTLSANIADSQLGDRIAEIATDHIIEKMRGQGGLRSILFGSGPETFVKMVASPVRKLLARNINEIMEKNAERFTAEIIDSESERLMATPVSELLAGKQEQLAKIRDAVTGAYHTVVATRLHDILNAVDISGIIENRINEMDIEESERLILDVMKHELRALVMLGALLGFIMGCINLLF